MLPPPFQTLINYLNLSRYVHGTQGHTLETSPKVSESFGALQFPANLGVQSAENNPQGHEDDQMHKIVAFHVLQSISSPEVNSWGHVRHQL